MNFLKHNAAILSLALVTLIGASFTNFALGGGPVVGGSSETTVSVSGSITGTGTTASPIACTAASEVVGGCLSAGGQSIAGIKTFTAGVISSAGNPQWSCTGTVATCEVRSSINAATASSTVGAITLAPATTLDANDLVLNVFDVTGGTSVFRVDEDGDTTMGALVSIDGSSRLETSTSTGTRVVYSPFELRVNSLGAMLSGTSFQLYPEANNNVALGTSALAFTNLFLTGTVNTSIASGSNALAVATNGARVDFGAGASDYASSDGTTVSFAGPIAVGGTSPQVTCSLATATCGITSSINDATASNTVGAFTLRSSVDIADTDLMLDLQNSANTSIFSVAENGGVVYGATLRSTTTTSAAIITSGRTAASTTATAATTEIGTSATMDANDLIVGVLAGAVYVWSVDLEGDALMSGSLNLPTTGAGSCTLDGLSPSTCAVTVTAAAFCTCSPVGTTAAIAAGGCAVSLAASTLTITGPNAATNVVNYHCIL